MRALLTNPGFPISLLVALGVTVVFALVFGASLAILLILGTLTALVEHALRSETEPPP